MNIITDKDFTFILSVSDDEGMLSQTDSVTITVVAGLPSAPVSPTLNVTSDHGIVTLTWDKASELSLDSFTGYADFEGYRVYRSKDNGQTWGNSDDKIYDYDGNLKDSIFAFADSIELKPNYYFKGKGRIYFFKQKAEIPDHEDYTSKCYPHIV